MRALGPAAVRRMNPDARTVEMEPGGASRPLLYVLGEAPGKLEDEQGEPFVGPSGKYLREVLPRHLLADVAFDNVVRTRPPENRDPKPAEIEAFRTTVESSIEEAAPRVILALGRFALGWAVGDESLHAARGRRFPVRVGSHDCWLVPTLHPSFILRLDWGRGSPRYRDVPAPEWRRAFELDVAYAAEGAAGAWGDPKIARTDERSLFGRVRFARRVEEIEDGLLELAEGGYACVDLETHGLRPYATDRMLLTVAVSDGNRTLVFPVEHEQAGLSAAQQKRILYALKSFLTCGFRVSAHNVNFEAEWLAELLGPEVLLGSKWEDSMQAAYVLDQRPGGLSLNFQCLVEFGLPLKKLTPAASMRKRMREVGLEELLRYNALDAKYGARLCRRLVRRLPERLRWTYRSQVDRTLAVVQAQRVGLPVDQEANRDLALEVGRDLAKVQAEARKRPEVVQYEKHRERFNVESPAQVGYVLSKMLGFEEAAKSTREEVLRDIDHPLARIVLEHRGLVKLLGTYIEPFRAGADDGLLWPDGRIHCSFKTCFTGTGRLSSEEPNNQNWPKVKRKDVRRQLVAPPGYVLVAVDQGQIEARVIAMVSLDPTWIRMIRENYDVHREWAERAARAWPELLGRHDGDLKKLRQLIKNKFVFPLFFGAAARSVAGYLNIPEEVGAELYEEFWDVFGGVRTWHRDVARFYAEHFYVECLTGRRRWGPLNPNMVINTPVQGSAAEIVIDAMVRLFRRALVEDRPWLQPVLQVHDDLTFLVPKRRLDEAVEVVVEEMVTTPFSWVNVPLSVDVETGPNLFEMKRIGTFRSSERGIVSA